MSNTPRRSPYSDSGLYLSPEEIAVWDEVARTLALIDRRFASDPQVAPTVHRSVTATAHALYTALRRSSDRAPDAVYPLPDGNVVLEWQYHGAGETHRYEACPEGHVQLMICYRDPRKDTEFIDFRIRTRPDATPAAPSWGRPATGGSNWEHYLAS